jgi:V8-like Glu-specific endopeptidase
VLPILYKEAKVRKYKFLIKLAFIASACVPAYSIAEQISCPKATIVSLTTESPLPWVQFEDQLVMNLTHWNGSDPNTLARDVRAESLAGESQPYRSLYQGFIQPAGALGGVRDVHHLWQPTKIILNPETWLVTLDPHKSTYPYKTTTDYKIGSITQELYPNIPTKIIEDITSPKGSCNNYATDKYKASHRIIYSSSELFNGTVARLKSGQFPPHFSSYQKKLSEDFVDATREVLANCYIPAEESMFAQHHAILKSIGTIYDGVNPICTALLVARDGKILTARHCFDSLTKRTSDKIKSALLFKPANDNNTYEICSILERNAFLNKSRLAKDDQVVARIAKGDFSPAILIIPPSSELTTPDTRKPENSPASLVQISQFPFASLVFPERFKSGFVQSISSSCIVLSKEAGCFSHTCSATFGGSGSSIFFSTMDNLSLAGTHIGDSTNNYDDCTLPYELQLNSGTYINERIRSLIR